MRRTRATTTTTTRRPSLMDRLRGRHRAAQTTHHHPHHHHHNHTVAAAPVRRQRRKPSIGDKVSGALLKLKGSLTHRPGEKAAGTRRMRGTDGKGQHRGARREYY